MNNLVDRWDRNPIFIKMLRLALHLETLDAPGELRSWFDQAPRTSHYATEKERLDFRFVNLSGQTVEDALLCNSVIDEANCTYSVFNRTEFQESSARRANFTGSRFILAQMSPFYAHQAIFKECIFEGCFVTGFYGADRPNKWAFSDLSECDFTNARAIKTYFDQCDFRGANLTNACFSECNLGRSDLRNVYLDKTVFKGCGLWGGQFSDLPFVHRMIEQGNNQDLDFIVWA